MHWLLLILPCAWVLFTYGWSAVVVLAVMALFCMVVFDVDKFLTENGWIVRHYQDYNEQDIFKRDKDHPAIEKVSKGIQ